MHSVRELRAVRSCSHSADAPNVFCVHMQRDAYVMLHFIGSELSALVIFDG